MNEFLFTQVLTELEDAVGRENCSVKEIDKATHSADFFWLSRMWVDRGRRMPEADFIVSPLNAEETSKVLKNSPSGVATFPLKLQTTTRSLLLRGAAEQVRRVVRFPYAAVSFLIQRE